MKNKYIIYAIFVVLVLLFGLYMTSDWRIQKNIDKCNDLINDMLDRTQY